VADKPSEQAELIGCFGWIWIFAVDWSGCHADPSARGRAAAAALCSQRRWFRFCQKYGFLLKFQQKFSQHAIGDWLVCLTGVGRMWELQGVRPAQEKFSGHFWCYMAASEPLIWEVRKQTTKSSVVLTSDEEYSGAYERKKKNTERTGKRKL
jgi:hypothetical protein